MSFIPPVPNNHTSARDETFYVVARYPLTSWHAYPGQDGGFSVNISVGTDVLFSLQMAGDAESARAVGTLSEPDGGWWYSSGSLPSSGPLKWDLGFRRVYGWYGQNWFEDIDELLQKGVLQWNTWMHCAYVDGSVTTGGKTLKNYVHSPRYRAYGDMNWGTQFPVGPPHVNEPRTYNWGWYYVGKSATSSNDDELSFIAGTGTEYAGFPLGTMKASFADFHLSKKDHVEIIIAGFWDGSNATGQNFAGTNDGEVLEFNVERSNWITYIDHMGTAEIPLHQTLTARTSQHTIQLEFRSKRESYNRLLFPTKGLIFSDFEALGVETVVTVLAPQTNMTFTTFTGGLEFGYHVPSSRGQSMK
jgi:hypothetical protein